MIDIFWRVMTAIQWVLIVGAVAFFFIVACMIQGAENRKKQAKQEVCHAES